ncbi:aminofutalosine synthase MqnE [Pinibacter aurantiacus]|uniref:Aminodeoxyfutalosine synthase n=1 Tax=Pinibacter aurantiacus TaxID=2851599 RepID=A0A9E2SDP1_9BACT|nr:aminofutalosine synthase MqnE [Pinibacter aurantiacus]MBV4360207.1 aminofutalosine synthase MqnE [Pinibacter aurantiacus]
MIITDSTISIEKIIEAEKEKALRSIGEKIIHKERITEEEGVLLFEKGSLPFVGALANHVRERLHGNKTYFNRNFHIEPTNVCVFSCKFCSYSRLYAHREEGWELTTDDMLNIVKKYDGKPVTEVHIVGGVHPKLNLNFFADLLQKIKAHRPDLHVKGFTAVELDYMFRKAKMTIEEGMKFLHEAGLQSLPGGGAEIFAPEIRTQICEDKVDAAGWLAIHEAAHKLGMHSNATMLYGHIEKFHHRIDHMERLRSLQDKTGGFNTFIPLKFRNKQNDMSNVPESSVTEDMRLYAIARLYMDNFPHLKAYWPMLGRKNAQLSLAFGVNDIDGTIDDSTKIYSMAGSEEQTPVMSTAEMVALIKQVKRQPVERDTLYNEIRDYSDIDLKEIEVNPLLN